jgi:hypothetical protein
LSFLYINPRVHEIPNFGGKIFGKLKKALNLTSNKLQVQLPLDQRYGVIVGDDQAAMKQCMAQEMSKQ